MSHVPATYCARGCAESDAYAASSGSRVDEWSLRGLAVIHVGGQNVRDGRSLEATSRGPKPGTGRDPAPGRTRGAAGEGPRKGAAFSGRKRGLLPSRTSSRLTSPSCATSPPTPIVNLAHNLDLRVIAEGVETKVQLAYLREKGCDEIQGFFSRSRGGDEFAASCRRGRKLNCPVCSRDGRWKVPTSRLAVFRADGTIWRPWGGVSQGSLGERGRCA